MSEDYSNVLGGKLKIKGMPSLPGIQKKKKKKATPVNEEVAKKIIQEEKEKEPQRPIIVVEKTEAEKRFSEARLQREKDRVKKGAAKSHRQKIDEFNTYLNTLSEHHDIPKVGPG